MSEREINSHSFGSTTTGIYEMTRTTYRCQNEACQMHGSHSVLRAAEDVDCPAAEVWVDDGGNEYREWRALDADAAPSGGGGDG